MHVRKGVLSAVITFSDSFLLEQATQNDLTEDQYNFLELGFSENGNQESCFEHEVVNLMSGYKDQFDIGLLNINSIHEKFLEIKLILSILIIDNQFENFKIRFIFITRKSKSGIVFYAPWVLRINESGCSTMKSTCSSRLLGTYKEPFKNSNQIKSLLKFNLNKAKVWNWLSILK